jgi:hypothetical protein
MAYTTPTLLLVGAAQHLVLGSNSSDPPTQCRKDDNPLALQTLSRDPAEW